jgi:phosphatidylserine/phosphatidylglycerophosphate/cardiolipin synthase-like enzyme/uncharacterized membrane protein YdjX (TVP38/TMEM64 family)
LDTLGAIIEAAVRRTRTLHVHILLWDYALIYVFERQPLPLVSFVWLSHPRIFVRHDGTAPAGASHHQKLVVIDDDLAFVGGLDLTLNRWDTRSHRPHDERRVDMGKPYPPFHDVQIAVAGEAARVVRDIARSRWARATGTPLRRSHATARIWPDVLRPTVRDAEVVIASASEAVVDPQAGEIERLYLECIHAARHWLYFENQYLTSWAIGEALERSLARPDGPEIVLVLPYQASGWLEQSTMDVLRTRLLVRLKAADVHGRLRVYHPVVGDEMGQEAPVYVHAKVLIVDDVIARVGSSNLSNRSMGLDTECDVILHGSGDARVQLAIAEFRNSLLAEHLDADAVAVEQTIGATGSLIEAIERHGSERRSLRPGVAMAPEWMLEALPDRAIVDPERPIELRRWLEEGLPRGVREGTEVNLKVVGVVAAIGGAVVALFHGGGGWGLLLPMHDVPHLFLGFLVLYGLAVFIPVPVTLLNVAVLLVQGTALGSTQAALGSALNASLAYVAGRQLGRDTIRRWTGTHLNRVARRLARRGAVSVAVARALPIAPFSAVGLVCGASGVRVGDYVVGTVLGMAPNLVVTVVAVSCLDNAISAPTALNVAVAAVVLGSVATIAFLIARVLNKLGGQRSSGGAA